jgi:hypothetical protein
MSDVMPKPLTKAQRVSRARRSGSFLRAFARLQEQRVRDRFEKLGRDPEAEALGMLLLAKEELDGLVAALTGEAP